jgi:hypothetical protein
LSDFLELDFRDSSLVFLIRKFVQHLGKSVVDELGIFVVDFSEKKSHVFHQGNILVQKQIDKDADLGFKFEIIVQNQMSQN